MKGGKTEATGYGYKTGDRDKTQEEEKRGTKGDRKEKETRKRQRKEAGKRGREETG